MDATYPNIQEKISVQTLTPVKKALILSAAIAPLVLGACSSGAEETTAAEESSTTTMAADHATDEAVEEDTETPDVGEQDAEEAEQAERDAAAADGQEDSLSAAADHGQIDPAAAAVDPFNSGPGTRPELAPVEGGEPANEADRAELEGLLNGMYDATTLHGFLGYLPANTCNELLAEQGGAAAFDLGGIPDLPMSAVPSYLEANPRVDSVENIQVNGDTASASVTATSGGESTTDTHRFRYEDGAWKFCN